ncbi:hypothetical protein [Bradyrhizobium sp. RDI18]|uniref:hypothetical protein n=1 Tax=Bradyrhizobium sp. RDI18 TaxID=3367400 RepID=UPI00371982BB
MAEIRLDRFEDDTIVLHFGGPAESIDAYTLAEALIGFADTARAISETIEPGTEIEIVVEAAGPGSYRTQLRRVKKDYGGLITITGTVFWGVVSNVVYDATLKTDPKPEITVKSDEVIIKHGNDTIIVPRTVYEHAKNAEKNPAVQSGLSRTFAALEADKTVTDFGITDLDPRPRPTHQNPARRISEERIIYDAARRTAKRARADDARASHCAQGVAQSCKTQMVL